MVNELDWFLSCRQNKGFPDAFILQLVVLAFYKHKLSIFQAVFPFTSGNISLGDC